MIIFAYIITALAFIAVLFTLVMGAISMGGKSEDARQKSNLWMRRRVWSQLAALFALAFLFYIKRTTG